MSVQAAKDFIEHALDDPALLKIAREHWENVLKVASDHGFQFTKQELADAMRERKASGQEKKPGHGGPGHGDGPGDDGPDPCVACCGCSL